MLSFFNRRFGTSFMPHVLGLRAFDVIWLRVISDGLIVLALNRVNWSIVAVYANFCKVVLAYGSIPRGLILNGEVRFSLQQHDRLILLAVDKYRSPAYLDNLAR